MDRQYIDEQHIVARYLADQLSDAELEAFEAYYLEHPEILREIEATARFKAGLAQLQTSGELAALLKPRPWYAQWRYLTVAAIVIVLVAVALYLRTPTPPFIVADLSALGHSTTVASSHTVLRRRGSSFDAEVTLPGPGKAVELRVLPEFAAPDSRYRIVLSRIDADHDKERLTQIEHLSTNDDGMVTLYLAGPTVAPGDYEITIASDAPTGSSQTSTFLIRVSR